MANAISNTSPLLYLHRTGALDWLPQLFQSVWTPNAVKLEFEEGRRKGHDVPNLTAHSWLEIVDPASMPSEWLSLDLGRGELAAMALALEHRERIVLLDDGLARRTAHAAGLTVRGTLGLLIDAKNRGIIACVEPWIDKLEEAGMWISGEIRRRILVVAGETSSSMR
jgi:predicted nucleic acid-binding protein